MTLPQLSSLMRLTWLRELIIYGLVSAAALAVDMAILLLLAPHVHYLWAACISFVAGGFVAYWLSVRFVFRHRRLQQTHAELTLFLLLGLAGLGINALIISITVNFWSAPLGISKLLAAIGTFTCNFCLRKWLLFSRQSAASSITEVLPNQ